MVACKSSTSLTMCLNGALCIQGAFSMYLATGTHEAACIYGCVPIKYVFDNEHARGCVRSRSEAELTTIFDPSDKSFQPENS